MATKSNGSNESRDDYNWGILSHSYTHRSSRRGQSGYNSARRYENRRKGAGNWNTDTWRKEDRYDSRDSSRRSSASRFQASVSYDIVHGHDTDRQCLETRKFGERKKHVRKLMRDNDKVVSNWGMNAEDSLGLQADEQNQPRTVEVAALSNMDSIKVISHKQVVNDENYMPDDKKDTWHNCKQETTKSVASRGGPSINTYRRASGMYTKGQGNERYKKRTDPTVRKPIDSEQARVLTEQLIAESYECMVCCECLRSSQATWCCQNCYHLFHLKCIKMWVKSCSASMNERLGNGAGWRCPACQNVSLEIPTKYTCFCGKMTNPPWNPRFGIIPHSCGEVCKKKRMAPPCPHACNGLCHPGPCPSCPVMVTKECPCSKTRVKMRCGQTPIFKCKRICEKVLNCGMHLCQALCHEGNCGKCEITENQCCFCGKENRHRSCGEDRIGVIVDNDGVSKYSCENICNRPLECGNHFCSKQCHSGPCELCEYLPQNVVSCHCKQTSLSDILAPEESRQSCLDPIPCCDKTCGKKLQCGSHGNEHYCKEKCHAGPCNSCDGITTVTCRCGSTEMAIPCTEYNPGQEILCERRCIKKRKCGRHKCNKKCCIDSEHNCPLICGKKLTCGLHKCDELCHQGKCPRCWQTSFEERTCYCGETVQYPPIPCGTPLPQCKMQCTRPHPCGHEPQHVCHNEERCPPCVVLTEKLCSCGKDVRKNIPCHLPNVSCGTPCRKELPCKLHLCLKICHKGQCLENEENCHQPCPLKRRDCPHPCQAPCHVGEECPESPCKSQIVIKCKCGRKSAKVTCLAGNARTQYHRLASEAMGDKLRNLRAGQSFDISGLIVAEKRRGLECDEECALFERNKRFADALGIDNPEASTFKSLSFSNSLKDEAKAQLPFVKTVEDAIESLIHQLKKSSVAQLSHSFPPMNSNQRKLIHELAEHYNCKTVSYDPEPKRNTVVTATRESVIVNTKLSAVIERKMYKPPPNPVLVFEKKSLNFQEIQRKSMGTKPKTQSIDYFDDDVE